MGFYSAVVPIYRRFPHSPSYPERVGRRRRFTRAGGALGELEERRGTGLWGGAWPLRDTSFLCLQSLLCFLLLCLWGSEPVLDKESVDLKVLAMSE